MRTPHIPPDKLIAASLFVTSGVLSVVVAKPLAYFLIGLALGVVIGVYLKKQPTVQKSSETASEHPPKEIGQEKTDSVQPNLRPQVPEFTSIGLEGDIWTKRPTTNRALAMMGASILIPIRNEPKQQGKAVATAKNIKARLVWYVDGEERCEAFPATWLEEWLNVVQIGAEAKRIVVAFELRRHDWQIVTNSRNDSSLPGVTSMHFEPALRVPKDGKGKLELQILNVRRDAIETLATYVYDWRWEEDQTPYLSPRTS